MTLTIIGLTLIWNCLAPLSPDETIFVHVFDAQGQLVAQADGAPLHELFPLSECQPGEQIRDVRSLTLPTGTFTIKVGVYNRATQQRLSGQLMAAANHSPTTPLQSSRRTHHDDNASRILRITHYALHVSRFTQHDLAMIMLAMLMMRLLSVITLRVGGYIAETGPDSAYHFQLGRLAAGGAYPFVNYWVEYPPFFPWLSVLAYKLSALLPSWIDQRFWFNLALHGLIIPFDSPMSS